MILGTSLLVFDVYFGNSVYFSRSRKLINLLLLLRCLLKLRGVEVATGACAQIELLLLLLDVFTLFKQCFQCLLVKRG